MKKTFWAWMCSGDFKEPPDTGVALFSTKEDLEAGSTCLGDKPDDCHAVKVRVVLEALDA